MKDKVKKVKVELIAKELGDVGTTPSKTSLHWNIRGEPREPVNPSPASPVTRDSIPLLEAKSLEPFARELRIDYLVPAESLKTNATKTKK